MNTLALSDDLNVITAEINSYKQVAGQSIFEIGKRLKHVKEAKLAERHGGWTEWLESVQIDDSQARKYVQVYNEFGNRSTSNAMGLNALYEIATLPQEARDQPHTIPSTGDTKTVDEMTVRELREVKKSLKEAEAAKVAAEQSLKASDKRARQLEEKQQALQAQLEQLQSMPTMSDEHRKEIDKLLDERNKLSDQLRIMRESYEEKLAYFDRRVVWMKDMRKAMNRATAMLMTDLSTALADFMSFTESKEAIEMMDHFFLEIDKVLADKKEWYHDILKRNEIEVTRDGDGTFNRVGHTVIIDGEYQTQEGE